MSEQLPSDQCPHPHGQVQEPCWIPGTRTVLPAICMACGAVIEPGDSMEILFTQEIDCG